MGHDKHTVAVFAPNLGLSVTIEKTGNGNGDEIHFHPSGQGFWTARMLRHLGERPLLCGPLGGESGRVIRGLLPRWGLDVSPIETETHSPATIQDRRSGERLPVAEAPAAPLDRHALDDIYSQFLDHAIIAGLAVISGQNGEVVPNDTYRRLAHDLESTDVRVVADFHGAEMEAFFDGGSVDILKISDENLQSDGVLDGDDDEDAEKAVAAMTAKGARNVVLSRASRPVLASFGGRRYVASPPQLEEADFRGAGDSMTAGLAASLRRGLGPEDTLRLACGAGAANVTRHGLGSTSEGLFERLAEQVEVTALPGP